VEAFGFDELDMWEPGMARMEKKSQDYVDKWNGVTVKIERRKGGVRLFFANIRRLVLVEEMRNPWCDSQSCRRLTAFWRMRYERIKNDFIILIIKFKI